MRLAGAAALAAAWYGFALAQQQPAIPPSSDPGALQQRSIELERRIFEEQRRPTEQRPLRRDLEKPAVPPASSTVRFKVNRVEFSKSEILSEPELRGIAAQFEGRELTIDEVRQIAAKVNVLYKEKGVVSAEAFVPPQDVTDGVVQIRLVEGRLGSISISGNATTRADYITDRLTLKRADLVDIGRVEKDLIRFNRSNDAQLRAQLRPGEAVGETDLQVAVQEPPRHDLRAFIDNSGSESTGNLRSGLIYTNRSLFGIRDNLTLSGSLADGQQGYSAVYGLPVTPYGTRANFGYYNDRTKIVHGPFQDLHISGESIAYTAQLRHPLLLGATYQLDGLVGAKKRRTTTWIDSVVLQSTDTADKNLGIDGQLVSGRAYWLGSLTRSWGVATNPLTDVQRYKIWRGNVRNSQPLPRDGWTLNTTVNFQYSSDRNLPASEQFLLGGEGSVRGYRLGISSGDRGYVVNVELHHPLPGVAAGTSGFFFIDHGEAWPFRPVGSQLGRDDLTGAGWGMNMAVTASTTARFALAKALHDRAEDQRSGYLLFQVIMSFL